MTVSIEIPAEKKRRRLILKLSLFFLFVWLGFVIDSSEHVQALNHNIYGEDATIFEGQTTVCDFNNSKKGILRIIKKAIGEPADFYYRVIPTPSILRLKTDTPTNDPDYENQYTGKETMLLSDGKYKISETVPSDRWIMRKIYCNIGTPCGDEICDEPLETCNNCPLDCGKCNPPSPPSAPPQSSTVGPTGKIIPGKYAIEEVGVVIGQTTTCSFENELVALKIVTQAIGGKGTEAFDYNIMGYDSGSPSKSSRYLTVKADKKIREDKARGDEYQGSDGVYLKPALTSYTVTQVAPDGWFLNSVECSLQGGKETGLPLQYRWGAFNITIQPDKITTCTFINTKNGQIVIDKNADGAEGGEEFNYDINFISSEYLPYLSIKDSISISSLLKTAKVKVDKNGLGLFSNAGFAAVASSGTENRIMTSYDGSFWKIRKSPKDENGDYVDNDWKSVTYGNGLFVAVSDSGSGDRVMTSPDGIDWTIRKTPKDNNWQSVAYGNGLFVAVSDSGSGNRVMTSPDGINWTIGNSPKDKNGNYVDNNWQSVAYGDGLFVAVADSGTENRIMTSINGITWGIGESPKDEKGDYVDNDWNGVAYGKGIFAAVASSGTENRIMTSYDGSFWKIRKSPKDENGDYVDNDWKSITYGNGLFVAVSDSGSGNRVMTSPDGIDWTIRKTPKDNNWQSVAYGNGLFVAVANSGTNDRVMTSPDGINWTIASSAADNDWRGIFARNISLYPGSYQIIEHLPENISKDKDKKKWAWGIKSVKCKSEDGEMTGENIGRGANNLKIAAGKKTICYFENVLKESSKPGKTSRPGSSSDEELKPDKN